MGMQDDNLNKRKLWNKLCRVYGRFLIVALCVIFTYQNINKNGFWNRRDKIIIQRTPM